MCELHWGTKEKCQSSCQYTPTYRIVLPYHASRWFIHSTRNWQTTWKQWKVFAVLPACVYVLVHTSDILQNDEIWKTNSRLWLCDPTTRAQVSWFFFFWFMCVNSQWRECLLFYCSSSKRWQGLAGIIKLRSVSCNRTTMRYNVISSATLCKNRLEYSTQTISLLLRWYLSACSTRNWFKKTIIV